MRSPLIRPLVSPVILLVMLGVGLTTGLSYFYTKHSVEDLALSQMSQSLTFLNNEISNKIKFVQADAVLWAQEEIFRLALSEGYLGRSARAAADKRLAERAANRGYDRIFLVNANGDVISASDPSIPGTLTLADRRHFQLAMRGKLALDTIETSKYSGVPVFVVADGIVDQEKVAGVLVLVLDIGRLSRALLEGVRVGKTGGACIFGPPGKKLERPFWKGDGLPDLPANTVAGLRKAGPGQQIRFTAGQKESLAMAVTNPETDWLIVMEADSSELLAPAQRLAALNGGIALAVLVLVGVALAVLRRAIVRLHESESRYRILTETIPAGIATIDKNRNPVYMNRQAQRILEVSDSEGGWTGWLARFEGREGHPLRFEELPLALALSGSENILPKIVWYRKPSEERVILSLSAAPLPLDGGAVAVFEDITERIRLQEVMVQTEKMLSIGGLAAGMAHEINNPLASILQAAQILKRRFDPSLPANTNAAQSVGIDLDALGRYMKERGLDDFLAGIQEAGERAAKIIKNMLGFARKSGGEYTECDMAELLDRTVELAQGDYDLRKQTDFKKIEIVRDYQPGIGPVECQSMEIEQVFFNIIKNAAQALEDRDPNGEPPRITLRSRAEGNYVLVDIEDNGPGMTEENRKRIFEPFFTTKSIGVGTGLGLSVAYFIVSDNHKGDILLESSPGKGAKFTVKLPFKRV